MDFKHVPFTPVLLLICYHDLIPECIFIVILVVSMMSSQDNLSYYCRNLLCIWSASLDSWLCLFRGVSWFQKCIDSLRLVDHVVKSLLICFVSGFSLVHASTSIVINFFMDWLHVVHVFSSDSLTLATLPFCHCSDHAKIEYLLF